MSVPKLDAATVAAVEIARAAAEEAAGAEAVGEHQGVSPESGVRVVTHYFEAQLAGYRGWHWAVTLVRAARAKQPTVNEVVLLPQSGALLAPDWVPWEERIEPGDIGPGMLMATADNDPRLEPGFAARDLPVDADPAEWAQLRSTVAELGLGRERVLSREGRDRAAERWLKGPPGPDDEASRKAPAHCATCGYFVPLRGSLGALFGACTNEYSASDGRVVSLEHGCGGHSDVVAAERARELPAPTYATIDTDTDIFD